MARKVDFPTFFAMWAEVRRWEVPDIHWRAVHWLEHRRDLAVLRCFRGFGKSTVLGVYNAWRYYRNPAYRILHQGDQDATAYKTSRDTKAVLTKHPLTAAWFTAGSRGDVKFWWVPDAEDERNPSMQAAGILSNITSSRADEVQNDDVEVPKNIQTPEAREMLRYRLGEQTHILVPGGRTLYIGTPHTHDSIYDEQERMGADCLTIRMFEREHRIEDAKLRAYTLPFVPELVFSGIGEQARLLREGVDFDLRGSTITFYAPPGGLVDFYAGCAWPERFTHAELLKRRQKTRTLGEWDSQYQLHSKPVGEVRLDPERLVPYDAELRLEHANRIPRLLLGKTQIMSARAYWDPSKGKAGNDASAFSLLLDDANGNQYWHCAEAMVGELAEFADQTNTKIIGGQVMQVVELVKRYRIPTVYVETNGVGAFVPGILRRALRQEQLVCGVVEVQVSGNKNARILGALEAPLSSGVLWAHVRVLDGPTWDQMKDWNPAVKDQPDDYLDSGAGALLQAPVRIAHHRNGEISPSRPADDWRPRAGQAEVAYER